MNLVVACCLLGVAVAIPDVAELQYKLQQRFQTPSFYKQPQPQQKYQAFSYYKPSQYQPQQKFKPYSSNRQPAFYQHQKYLPPYQSSTYGSNQPRVPIISQSNYLKPDGSFNYGYQTGDGQQVNAQGYLKNPGQGDKEAEVIQGGYAYTSPEGTPVSIRYIADENGFRTLGSHQGAPALQPIHRSVAYISKHERSQQYQNNEYYKSEQRQSYEAPYYSQEKSSYNPYYYK